jgi:type I restriction enzyme S subunit
VNAADLLTSLPDGWRRVPLKTISDFAVSNVDKHSFDDELPVRLCNYTDVYKNDQVSPNMDLMAATATPQEIARFRLEVGDVVITKDSESWNDIAIPAYVAGTADDFICGYHLAFIRPRKDLLEGRFLFRCMQSRPVSLQLELEATGVTRYGLPKDAIGLALLPLAPLPTQLRIANYLDRETARIDGLIAEKERMLALLEEKRAALISRVVTRGLDPKTPLKPSGQEWLGEIPAHWEEIRLGFLVSLQGGATPTTTNNAFWDGDIPWASPKDIKQPVLFDTIDHVSEFALSETSISLIKPPALLLVVRGMILAKAVPTALIAVPMTINQDMKALQPSSTRITPEYLKLVFDGMQEPLFTLIEESAHGTRCLRTDMLTSFKIPVPPQAEQLAIIRSVESDQRKTSALRDSLRLSITLAKERRAALISAAVTGQIDLRGENVKKGIIHGTR